MADCDLCGNELDRDVANYKKEEVEFEDKAFGLILEYPDAVVGNDGRFKSVTKTLDQEEICQFCSSTIKHLIETLRTGNDPLAKTDNEEDDDNDDSDHGRDYPTQGAPGH